MPIYTCERCKKEFKQKSNFMYHKNRKIPCKELTEGDTLTNTESQNDYLNFDNECVENECEYCKKVLSTTSNYNRHIKNCKFKIMVESELSEKRKLLKVIDDLNKKLKQKELNEVIIKENQCEFCYKIFSSNSNYNKHKKICKCSQTTNNIDMSHNTHNTHNTQNININLSPFGKEDLGHIESQLMNLVRFFNYKTINNMIENKHFNENLPQNHNVYIPNIKNKFAAVYNGKKWTLVNSNEIIDDMIKKNYYILEDFYNANVDKLEELKYKDSQAYDRFIDFLSIINDDDRNEDMDGVKEDVFLTLYNNRDIPLKTKRKNNAIEL